MSDTTNRVLAAPMLAREIERLAGQAGEPQAYAEAVKALVLRLMEAPSPEASALTKEAVVRLRCFHCPSPETIEAAYALGMEIDDEGRFLRAVLHDLIDAASVLQTDPADQRRFQLFLIGQAIWRLGESLSEVLDGDL